MIGDRIPFIRQASVAADVGVLTVSFWAASWLRNYLLTAVFVEKRMPCGMYEKLVNLLYQSDFAIPSEATISFDVQVNLLILIFGLWALCLKAYGAYDSGRFVSLKAEYATIAKAASCATLGLVLIGFLFRLEFFPRTLVIGFPLVSSSLLAIEKTGLYYGLKWFHRKGYGRRSILVIGSGQTAQEFVGSVKEHPEWGFDVIGLVGSDRSQVGSRILDTEVLGTAIEILEVLHKNEIDEVVFAVPGGDLEGMKVTLTLCEQEGVKAHIISDFFRTLTAQIKIGEIYGIPVLTFSTVPNKEWQFFLKRVFDAAASGALLFLLFPLLLLLVVLVKLTSSGPVFYRWQVVGLNKKRFTSYKFRTMIKDADALKQRLIDHNEMTGPVFKMKDDPRVTWVGKWLRKFSLDELPQLFSVLKGDMSLVGPRPPLVTEIDKFDSWQRRKMSVMPGMTCLWQVRGRNKITDFNDWARLDLEYIDTWSLWLDFKILIKTIPVVLGGKGC